MTRSASVLLTTQDGSAKSGTDYHPLSRTITFQPRTRQQEVHITILHSSADDSREERFYVTMQTKGNEHPKATVVIRSKIHEAMVLPSQPVVVSLLHYDNASGVEAAGPELGYPLVCVSPCENKHPLYEKTRLLCEDKNMTINYYWEVATPNEWHPLRYNAFKRLSKATIFTEVEAKVLDPIYFAPNYKVRCCTQPVKPNGRQGVPIKSEPVNVDGTKGFCKKGAYLEDSIVGSHTFNANLKYVNATAQHNPNTVHIKIEIPHSDGMIPLISTQPLHNVQTLLTDHLYTGHHSCSNLLVDKSFLKLSSRRSNAAAWPYQLDANLRGDGTVSLYKHLDLKSCLWKFNAWFHMSELLDYCHGKIISEFKVMLKVILVFL
jgi:extracelluar matrix protein FRAS1